MQKKNANKNLQWKLKLKNYPENDVPVQVYASVDSL